jgi:nitroimidazol reductase NimA-like FMN-containing flavoprotein (pyridoxamine 5'-phosphate oxidase superfamily)
VRRARQSPQALIDVLRGGNVGKMLVRLPEAASGHESTPTLTYAQEPQPMGLTADDLRFLARPRLGFLTVATRDGGDEWPTPMPVWFEAGEASVQLFTTPGSRKVRRIRATPRASLVAANDVGETEHWVAVTGPATVEADGAKELAGRLAERYWDLSDPGHAAALEGWLAADLVRIVIEAAQVTRYAE